MSAGATPSEPSRRPESPDPGSAPDAVANDGERTHAGRPPRAKLDPLRPDDEERFIAETTVGRGAHGAVYRALDRELGRYVALKAFEGATGEQLYRLKHEFRVLRGVAHPNLVQLYELVVEPQLPFFTMELLEDAVDVVRYVRGERAGGEPLDEAAYRRLRNAFVQLLDGLQALVDAQRLHRDLKPSNVLVVPGGRTVLLDFGLAERLGPDGTAGRGTFAGSPAYVAPEIFSGQGASEASDVYSAGVLLFEALTGTKFQRRGPLPPSPPDARSVVASVPDDLARLARALTAAKKDERPTIEDARRALVATGDIDVAEYVRFVTPFVGRETELQWLDARLAEAASGQTVVAMIDGESGIGKSELIRRFLADTDAAPVARARGARGAPLAFCGECRPRESVPVNALDGPTDDLSTYLLLRSGYVPTLTADAADALLQLFPVLQRVESLRPSVSRGGATDDVAPRERKRRAFAALAELLREVSGDRPVVVWVDDAQWGDEDSAAALFEMVQRRLPRLLLVLSYRAGAQDDSPFLRRFRDLPFAAHRMTVAALAESDCRALAERLSGAGSAADPIVEQSGGSPFVLQELSLRRRHRRRDESVGRARADADSGQVDGDAPAMLWRFDLIDPAARAIAEVVALGGSAIDVREVLDIGSIGTGEALVYRMQEQRLLRSGTTRPRGLEIYHDRLRETLLAALGDVRKRTLHRRIADTLLERPQPEAAALVEHLRGCGERAGAAKWAEIAGDEAERSLAFVRAARFYEIARGLRDGGARDWTLAAKLGHAVALGGDGMRGGRILQEAAAAAEACDAGIQEIMRLRVDAARELLCGGDVERGRVALRQMLASAGLPYPRHPGTAAASMFWQRARRRVGGLRFAETAENALAPSQLRKIDACWAGTIGLNSFDAIRSAAFQARHTVLALDAGEPKRVARALTAEAVYRAAEGRRDGRRRASELLERVESLAARLDDPRTTAYAHLCAGVSNYFAGRWQPAVERLRESQSLYERLHGTGWELSMSRMYRLWAYAWLGDAAALEHEQAAALEAAAASPDWLAGIVASSGHSNLRWLMQGDAPEARRQAGHAIAAFPVTGFQSPHYADLVAQTRIDLYEGDAWAAWERIATAWPRLRAALLLRFQMFRIELRHLRACAALAAARTDAPRPAHLARWSEQRLVRIARRDAKRLRREDLDLGGALAFTIEAALVERSHAPRVLRTAAAALSAAGAPLHASVAREIARTGRNDVSTLPDRPGVADAARLGPLIVPPLRM